MEQIELRTLSTNFTPMVVVTTRSESTVQKGILISCIYLIILLIAIGLIISPIIYNWSKINQLFPSGNINLTRNYLLPQEWKMRSPSS